MGLSQTKTAGVPSQAPVNIRKDAKLCDTKIPVKECTGQHNLKCARDGRKSSNGEGLKVVLIEGCSTIVEWKSLEKRIESVKKWKRCLDREMDAIQRKPQLERADADQAGRSRSKDSKKSIIKRLRGGESSASSNMSVDNRSDDDESTCVWAGCVQ